MRALPSIALLLSLVASSAGGIVAQRPPHTGERVRISGGAHPGEFTLTGREADTLLVQDPVEGDTLRVPLASVDSLAVLRKPSVGRGATIGLLFGGTTGALFGLMAGGGDCSGFCISPGEAALVLGGALGLIGMFIGAAGSAATSPHWQKVPTTTQVTVAPQPGGRIGVAFSLRR